MKQSGRAAGVLRFLEKNSFVRAQRGSTSAPFSIHTEPICTALPFSVVKAYLQRMPRAIVVVVEV